MTSIDLNIQSSVQALTRGACIAYPTEAVWGLGCDPSNTNSVAEILRIKQRPASKGLILIASNIEHFDFLLRDLHADIRRKMQQRWPGHVTWLVPHRGRVDRLVSGDSDKVAIRVSAHPVVQSLGGAFGRAFISTSANPAGLPAATSEDQVREYFNAENQLVYTHGQIGRELRPSTIIDAESGNVLRP